MCTRNVAFAVWRQSRISILSFLFVVVVVGSMPHFRNDHTTRKHKRNYFSIRYNAESAVIVWLFAVYAELPSEFHLICNR